MFQYRLDAFVITFLKSSAQPIGEVIEYVIHIEFQARGNPHAHTLIWIKDAPKLGYADEADVKTFIDKYICAHYLITIRSYETWYKVSRFIVIL